MRLLVKSTNIMLLAIVIMLFAIVFHLITSGLDDLTLLIAIIGVLVGLRGVFWNEKPTSSAQSQETSSAR